MKSPASGSLDAKAQSRLTQQVKVDIAGSGGVRAHSSGTAQVDIMGSGDVNISGGAKCTVNKMGSGQRQLLIGRFRGSLTIRVEGGLMRTFLPAVLALAIPSAPGFAATRNFGIESFTKVRVEGPYKVILTTGVAPFAKASGSTTGLDRIAIDVRGDTLVVQTNPSAWGGYPGEDPGPVEVTIGTHELSSAALTGAGSLSINHVEGLELCLVGARLGRCADRRCCGRPDGREPRRDGKCQIESAAQ